MIPGLSGPSRRMLSYTWTMQSKNIDTQDLSMKPVWVLQPIPVSYFYSCHSNDPDIAVLPLSDPWLGESIVIRLFGTSTAVL